MIDLVETPHLVAFRERLAAWRSLSHQEQLDRMGAMAADRDPEPDGGRYRVGLWAPCLIRGGAESWQDALIRSVDHRRISWQGCCILGGLGMVHRDALQRISVHMPVSAGRDEAIRLASRCEVLISWAGIDPAPLLGALAPERRPKVIHTVHMPSAGYLGTIAVPVESVDRFVAVSELALDAIPTEGIGRSSVIWNAIDPDRLVATRSRDEVRADWGVPSDSLVAGFLGRLAHEKDPIAMARLARGLGDPWQVVVVGEGHLRPEMRRLAREIPRLRIVDAVSHPGDTLRAFDILVVPSRYESFGLSIAEGIAVGLPVVSTPVGLATLLPGLTGEIPINADSGTLATAIEACYKEGTRPDAKAIVQARCSLDRFGREWTDLIASLAAPERRARVLGCPHRGNVLPVSEQPECGCGELSECRDGHGTIPGRVSVRECLDCTGHGHGHTQSGED
jgi:glycosyltransferase involved in cell wall biosynthesis